MIELARLWGVKMSVLEHRTREDAFAAQMPLVQEWLVLWMSDGVAHSLDDIQTQAAKKFPKLQSREIVIAAVRYLVWQRILQFQKDSLLVLNQSERSNAGKS